MQNSKEPNINVLDTLFDEDEKKKPMSVQDPILAYKIEKGHKKWTFSEKDEIFRFCLISEFSYSTAALLESTPELFSKWLKNDSETEEDFQLLINSVISVSDSHSLNLIKKFDTNEEQASAKTLEIFAFNL